MLSATPATNTRTSSNLPDTSFIKSEAQHKLFKLLDKFEGTKTIVWDDKLLGPFELIASAPLLREHDVVWWFRINDMKLALNSKTDFVLFFLKKDYQLVKFIAEVLHKVDRATLAKTSLVFVPQKCASIDKLLEYNKVDLEKLYSIEELPIELFVLDTDLLSMENEFVYRDMYLKDDYSAVHQIVEALVKLQNVYGPIARISGQGKGAKLVCDLLVKQRSFHPRNINHRAPAPQIHQLVLIDRRIDLVTPLLTQLTYEGVLDETFEINHGKVVLPSEKFLNMEEKLKNNNPNAAKPVLPPDQPGKTKTFEVRSSEELYTKLRDCHINAVGDTLKQTAKNLQAEYEECNSKGKTIHEMSKIVKRLNHYKVAKTSQAKHSTIAELVNERILQLEFIYGLRIEHDLLQDDRPNRIVPDIETKLLRQEPALHVLRLICLQSLLNNGLKPKISEYYKRELIQNYGDDYLEFLMNLERANLLLSQERQYSSSDTGGLSASSGASFGQLKSKFSLINDNVDECNPSHFSYVYGGYAPLSVSVVKTLALYSQTHQWRQANENLKLLPEPTVAYLDPLPASNTQTNLSSQDGGLIGGISSNLTAAIATASMLISTAASVAGGFGVAGGGGGGGGGGSTVASGVDVNLTRVRRNSATSNQSSSVDETRTVLVFFIGGCTFAEISALRFLSQQEENNCEFLIATTKVINGRTFLKSLWPFSTINSCSPTGRVLSSGDL